MKLTTGLLAVAAIGAFIVTRQRYRQHRTGHAAIAARLYVTERQAAVLQAVASAQGGAIADLAARTSRLERPQGSTPPWLS